MNNNNDVYIVLLNYNSAEDTIECIKSICKNELSLNFKIIVVDNNSTDESVTKLRKMNNIILIESQENSGFAKGNNLGIKYALERNAKFIWLLNNDTIIEKENILNQINAFKIDEKIGVIGSRIMYYSNRDLINYCGGRFNWLKGITVHERYKKRFNKNIPKFFFTDFVTGCSMMIKREVFENVGLLPEDYFMYFEDADFCIKISEAGYKMGVCTDSVVYHKVSASSGGEESPFSVKWMTRNRIIFIKKYNKYTKGVLTKIIFYLTRGIKIIENWIKGNKEISKAMLIGIKEGRKVIKSQNY